MNLVILALRLAVGATLVAAGALKVGHFSALASAIAGFRLLPSSVVAPLAVALPFLEILIGGYLIAGLFTRAAGSAACIAFLAYAGAIASAIVRHIPATCGCFGPGDAATADWPHVMFDVVLAAFAAAIALRPPGAFALDRRLQGA